MTTAKATPTTDEVLSLAKERLAEVLAYNTGGAYQQGDVIDAANAAVNIGKLEMQSREHAALNADQALQLDKNRVIDMVSDELGVFVNHILGMNPTPDQVRKAATTFIKTVAESVLGDKYVWDAKTAPPPREFQEPKPTPTWAMLDHVNQMTEFKMPAGTVVKLNGIPVNLKSETMLTCATQQAPLVFSSECDYPGRRTDLVKGCIVAEKMAAEMRIAIFEQKSPVNPLGQKLGLVTNPTPEQRKALERTLESYETFGSKPDALASLSYAIDADATLRRAQAEGSKYAEHQDLKPQN